MPHFIEAVLFRLPIFFGLFARVRTHWISLDVNETLICFVLISVDALLLAFAVARVLYQKFFSTNVQDLKFEFWKINVKRVWFDWNIIHLLDLIIFMVNQATAFDPNFTRSFELDTNCN